MKEKKSSWPLLGLLLMFFLLGVSVGRHFSRWNVLPTLKAIQEHLEKK